MVTGRRRGVPGSRRAVGCGALRSGRVRFVDGRLLLLRGGCSFGSASVIGTTSGSTLSVPTFGTGATPTGSGVVPFGAAVSASTPCGVTPSPSHRRPARPGLARARSTPVHPSPPNHRGRSHRQLPAGRPSWFRFRTATRTGSTRNRGPELVGESRASWTVAGTSAGVPVAAGATGAALCCADTAGSVPINTPSGFATGPARDVNCTTRTSDRIRFASIDGTAKPHTRMPAVATAQPVVNVFRGTCHRIKEPELDNVDSLRRRGGCNVAFPHPESSIRRATPDAVARHCNLIGAGIGNYRDVTNARPSRHILPVRGRLQIGVLG